MLAGEVVGRSQEGATQHEIYWSPHEFLRLPCHFQQLGSEEVREMVPTWIAK
jgi:hypothetical protein